MGMGEQDAAPMASATPERARLEMSLREAMETQRAIRRLRPDPVDDEVLLRCIELALKAPTGSNAQNWEFIIVRDPEAKGKLARQNRRAWSLYGGIGRWLYRRDERMLRVMDAVTWQADHYEEIPVLVVACLRGKRYMRFTVMGQSSFYGSVYPAIQNFLLACRAEGLGAALTTLPLWSVAVARRALGLPFNVLPVAIIPVGWPRGRYGPNTRKPVESVVHYDRYGHRTAAERPARTPSPQD